jgi:hypothetical protein
MAMQGQCFGAIVLYFIAKEGEFIGYENNVFILAIEIIQVVASIAYLIYLGVKEGHEKQSKEA